MGLGLRSLRLRGFEASRFGGLGFVEVSGFRG